MVTDEAEQTIGVPLEEMTMDKNNATTSNGAPEIIRKDEIIPASNTRASIQQKILSAVDILGRFLMAKQSAPRSYPLQFLVDFAGAVLDNETGELLKYCHII